MPRKGHSEQQILHAPRQAGGGEQLVGVCRQQEISEQMFYTKCPNCGSRRRKTRS